MKKLGLIGGMGPESTIPYYHDIIYGVHQKLGRDYYPELTIESVDVFTVLGYCQNKEYQKLCDYLLAAIRHLKASGADFAALSANTPHIIFDQLQKQSPLPLVSIVEATCNEARNRGYKRIGLLGTRFTMDGEFFKKPFLEHGIDVVTPDEKTKEFIHQHITQELEMGIVKDETREAFTQIINDMKEKEGIEAIVLGCTELPLLYQGVETPLPCLDTMKIHIDALIDKITEE
jgi:aspartate racemase